MSGYSQQMATPDPTDRCPGFITALILRCAAGDESAMASLFDHLLPLVLAIVGDRVPSAESDQRVGDTFVRLWRHAPAFDPKTTSSVEWVVQHALVEARSERPVTA